MQKILCCALGIGMAMLGWSAQTSTPATKKVPAKTRATAAKKSSTSASKSSTALHRKGSGVTKSTATHKPGSTSHRTSAGAGTGPGTGSSTAGKTASARSSAARRGKKGTATAGRRPATTWRNRQLAPTPDRYKEIQSALAAKGYLKPEEATGTWGASSASALKRFQADQNLDASGKLTAMSLIALGLGPKHETVMAKPPDAR